MNILIAKVNELHYDFKPGIALASEETRGFDWNNLSEDYAFRFDKRVQSQTGIYYDRYDDLLNRVVDLAEIRDRDRVLEIGCGTGELTRKLIQQSYSPVCAVDPSHQMLEEACVKSIKEGWLKQVNFECIENPFVALPYKDLSFSVVASTYAFHHVSEEDKRFAIEEMSRIIKTDGRLVIGDVMFPNAGAKNQALQYYRDELENEPFALLDFLYTQLTYNGFVMSMEQVGEITWVVRGLKR